MPKQLVVFDFDWSFVDQDTDRWVFEVLSTELRRLLQKRKSAGTGMQCTPDVVYVVVRSLPLSLAPSLSPSFLWLRLFAGYFPFPSSFSFSVSSSGSRFGFALTSALLQPRLCSSLGLLQPRLRSSLGLLQHWLCSSFGITSVITRRSCIRLYPFATLLRY
jgi:hypothetical protein